MSDPFDDDSVAAEGAIVNEYKLGGILGEGAFGEVRRGEKNTGEVVAVKCLSRSFLKKKREFHREGRRMKVKTALDDVQREIAIMKKVDHPNLVGLVEAIDNEETDNLYIVLEFVSGGQVMYWRGSEKRYFRTKTVAAGEDGDVYDEARAKELGRDILEGLRYLHAQDIIHRDLKPENLLLTDSGRCKIADFGIAQKLDLEKHKSASVTQMQGTHQFMAPEMITEAKYNGFLVDVWAVGVCLHALVCGSLPFWGDDTEAVFEVISTKELDLPGSLSDDLSDALTKILDKDPSSRATMDDLLAHPWFEFESVASVEKLELSSEEELNAITPFKLDIFKIVRLKQMGNGWRKQASERSKQLKAATSASSPVLGTFQEVDAGSSSTLGDAGDVAAAAAKVEAGATVSSPDLGAAIAAAPPAAPVKSASKDAAAAGSSAASSAAAAVAASEPGPAAQQQEEQQGSKVEKPPSGADCCTLL